MKKSRGCRQLTALIMVCAMTVLLSCVPAMAKQGDERFLEKAEQIAEKTGTEAVKTICWKARVTKGIKAPSLEKKKEVVVNAGDFVRVVQRDYHRDSGVSLCEIKEDVHCYIANQFLNFTEPLATGSEGDYSKATKEAYVNGQTIKSKTNTLVWVSLDKQRVNIFKGKNRNWKLVRTCKASTGRADAPTLDQTFKTKYIVQKKSRVVDSLQYYTFFFGSGIHKWPGAEMSKSLGKTPVSASCVRLNGKNAKWVFDDDNVPLKSRVWIW